MLKSVELKYAKSSYVCAKILDPKSAERNVQMLLLLDGCC